MNKVILMGRLTKEVEVRYTQSNTPVASFSLAVNRRFSKEKETDFINIVAWNKTAEFCQKFFKKGQQVAVVGRIQTRNYEKEDGTKVYITEVVAEETYFADSKKEESQANNEFKNRMPEEMFQEPYGMYPMGNDELPF
jgi:single-strand DNA-binding protein